DPAGGVPVRVQRVHDVEHRDSDAGCPASGRALPPVVVLVAQTGRTAQRQLAVLHHVLDRGGGEQAQADEGVGRAPGRHDPVAHGVVVPAVVAGGGDDGADA